MSDFDKLSLTYVEERFTQRIVQSELLVTLSLSKRDDTGRQSVHSIIATAADVLNSQDDVNGWNGKGFFFRCNTYITLDGRQR